MKKRQAGILVLALMMVLSMVTSAFAVSGAADSDSTDFITNRTGNSTAVRQKNSSNTGTIRLGKILTVNQQGKFPNIEDFVYRITPVAAWKNANGSTSKSGGKIPLKNMPVPGASDKAHHSVVVRKGDPWSILVSIGNFKNGSEGNTSSIYGDSNHNYVNSDNASNNKLIAEKMRRTRVTNVSFKFNAAGYYMYKIEEAGSSPNGSFDDPNNLRKDVAGVDYDDNTYYVVFYVCNREVKGDTVNGVYVHTITSWTNNTGTDYKPDNSMRTSDKLADAQNWYHDLMESQDVDSKYSTKYGDGGHPAALNTGRVKNDNAGGPSTVVHDNLGKVGISTPQNPDYLEAYRMWNGQVTQDVVLKKNVTGNLGDLTKEFVFEVTLTGLESNQTYTTGDPAAWTKDVTSAAVEMYDMKPVAGLAADGKSFTTDASGAVSFKVKLKDDETFVLNALPRSASYKVKEQASDHVAQYNIESSNDSSGDGGPVFAETSHTPGGKDAAHLGKANTDANTELSTETEFVDRYDDTVTITFRNNRDIATLTGFAGVDYMVYTASLAVLLLMALFIVRRRREYAEEDRMAE